MGHPQESHQCLRAFSSQVFQCNVGKGASGTLGPLGSPLVCDSHPYGEPDSGIPLFSLESIFPWKFKAEIPTGKVPSLFGLRLAQHFLSEELETNCWEMKAEGGGNMG